MLIHFAAAWFGPDLHNVGASDQDESSLKPQSGIRMSPVESKDAVSLPKPSHVAATFLEAAELLDQAMAKGRTQTLVFDQQKAITEGLVSLLQHTYPQIQQNLTTYPIVHHMVDYFDYSSNIPPLRRQALSPLKGHISPCFSVTCQTVVQSISWREAHMGDSQILKLRVWKQQNKFLKMGWRC